MIVTTYAVEVKNTEKASGASNGWETYCPHHDTMLLAITCKERAFKKAQKQYDDAPPEIRRGLERCMTELQIVKLTREVVEVSEEFVPAK